MRIQARLLAPSPIVRSQSWSPAARRACTCLSRPELEANIHRLPAVHLPPQAALQEGVLPQVAVPLGEAVAALTSVVAAEAAAEAEALTPAAAAAAGTTKAEPQFVAPVSRPAVLAASKPPEAEGAVLETCTAAALVSGAARFAVYG